MMMGEELCAHYQAATSPYNQGQDQRALLEKYLNDETEKPTKNTNKTFILVHNEYFNY